MEQYTAQENKLSTNNLILPLLLVGLMFL